MPNDLQWLWLRQPGNADAALGLERLDMMTDTALAQHATRTLKW